MADVKISGLPASTVPLAGTEVLPIVQSGTTKQVAVSNLTAGRAVSALSLTATDLTASTAAAIDANKKLVSLVQPAFSAQAASTQAISNATYTKVTLGTENFDTNSNFATSTFTPTVDGYYQINAAIFYNTSAATGLGQVLIYKNGSNIAASVGPMSAGGYAGLSVSTVVYCNGSTDYIDLYTYQSFGTTQSTSSGAYVFMAGALVRGA